MWEKSSRLVQGESCVSSGRRAESAKPEVKAGKHRASRLGSPRYDAGVCQWHCRRMASIWEISDTSADVLVKVLWGAQCRGMTLGRA